MFIFVSLKNRVMKQNVDVQKLKVLDGHMQAVYALASDSSGSFLYSAGADRLVMEWQLDNHDQMSVIAQATAPVYGLFFLAERNYLLIAQRDGILHFLDLSEKVLLKSLKLSEKEIFSVVYQADMDEIFIATGEGKILRCRLNDFVISAVNLSSSKSARCMALHPFKSQLAVGYSDNSIRIFDLDLNHLFTLSSHTFSVFSVAFSPNGILYSGGRDAHLKLWDAQSEYALVNDVIPHMFTVNDIQFFLDQNCFATASRDKSIRIWDVNTLELLKTIDKEKLDGHKHSVNKVVWIPSKNMLISAGDDSKVIAWSFKF